MSTAMRVFACFKKERQLLDVSSHDTVTSLKLKIQDVFQIDTNSRGEKKFVVLTYQGSELENQWVLQDVGINVGATLRVSLRAEIKPKLFIHCAFNDETVDILEEVDFDKTTVADLRSMITRKIGVPVTVYRLLTNDGRELFDANILSQYGLSFGNTVYMKTWDGWNDLLKCAVLGMARHCMYHLSNEDAVAKFQLRVMLFISAHYGHMDLATSVLKAGIRPDEAIGDHPSKEWCAGPHVESLRTPVHEAAEHGKISILKIFVHFNICCVTTKDGNGLTGLNIALRKRQREVALYLLTKQWSNVQFTAVTLPLTIYSQVRKWCDRAKDRVLLVYGLSRSSTRYKKTTDQPGALCGMGVHVDGFSKSAMNSKKAKNPSFNDASSRLMSPDRLPRISGVRTPALVNKYRMRIQEKAFGLDDEELLELADDFPMRPRSRSNPFEQTRPVLPKIRPSGLTKTGVTAASRGHVSRGHATRGHATRSATTTVSNIDYSHDADRRGKSSNSKSAYIHTTGGGALSKLRSNHPMSLAAPSTMAGDLNLMVGKRQKERNKRKRAASMDSVIPLPSSSIDINPTRPFFHKVTEESNIPRITVDLYEKLTGRTTWEQAVESLTIASTFKEKPWLSQVRMAMTLSKAHVQNVGTVRAKKGIADSLHTLDTPEKRLHSPRKDVHDERTGIHTA